MNTPRRAVLAIIISAMSLTLPAAAAQERGTGASAADGSSGPRATPARAAKGEQRRNLAVANRMLRVPEFMEAVRNGDANAAKRIFVAQGGSDDQVILVPVRGWNPMKGYNVSGPLPADVPNNPVVCQSYHVIPWGWNIQTQSYNGFKVVCWGPGREGNYGWEN
ncbi:MAG TPA: hypothetical protein VF535_06980 [Allosphingosinicella sp.]|jgi:hypothetical protein